MKNKKIKTNIAIQLLDHRHCQQLRLQGEPRLVKSPGLCFRLNLVVVL